MPLPRKNSASGRTKLVPSAWLSTKMMLPITEINTYKKIKNTALTRRWRLRFLAVRIIRAGPAKIMQKAINCWMPIVSPKTKKLINK